MRPNSPLLPPPTKSPTVATKEQKALSEDTFNLFVNNTRLIGEWYKSQPTPGRETGINITMEIVTGNILMAMEYALKGKTWKP